MTKEKKNIAPGAQQVNKKRFLNDLSSRFLVPPSVIVYNKARHRGTGIISPPRLLMLDGSWSRRYPWEPCRIHEIGIPWLVIASGNTVKKEDS